MDLRKPEDFYTKYLDDFDRDNGPGLLQLPWQRSSSALWTYQNMSYLTRLAMRVGFTPVGEHKKIDLCWFNKPPWAFSPEKVECELAVEEEWAAKSDDEDLRKLVGIRAYLKVFITALKYDDWRERRFHQTVAELLGESHPKRSDEAYLLINVSPYPTEKPCRGLQVTCPK